jgi:hypothetical protein
MEHPELVLTAILIVSITVVSVIIVMFIPVMSVTPIIVMIIPVPNTAGFDQCCCKNCAPTQGYYNFFHDVPPV